MHHGSVRVTVLGASGVLGRRVLRLLDQADHEVTALVRSEAAAERLPGGVARIGDVWDHQFLRRHVDGAEAVMMLATSIPTGTSAARTAAWRTNDRIRGELAPALARIAAECAVRVLVQESVMYVYRGSLAGLVGERAVLDPARSARTALLAERSAKDFLSDARSRQTPDPRAVALRFAGFVAQDSAQTRDAWQTARKGKALVFGDLAGWTTFVDVDDAAAAAVHALGVRSGVYNVGANPITKAAWLDLMSDLVGRPVEPPPAPLRVGLPHLAPVVGALQRSIGLDSSRLRATGWEPRFDNAAAIWAHAVPRGQHCAGVDTDVLGDVRRPVRGGDGCSAQRRGPAPSPVRGRVR